MLHTNKASEECYIIYKMCKCLHTILYIVHQNIDVLKYKLDFPGGSVVKNPPANAGDAGWEDPLGKAMATHSSRLAWETPWTEELGRLRSMVSQRVGHDLETKQQQKNVNYV